MNVTYVPGRGFLVSIQGKDEGISVVIGEHMTVAAIQRYIKELVEWIE